MKINEFIDVIDNTNAHVYVLKINDIIIQIDSGSKGNAKNIIKYYEEKSIKPNIIFITHYHADHIGSLADVFDKYKPKVYANKLEIPVIEGKEKMKGPLLPRLASAFMKPRSIEGVLDMELLSKELGSQGITAIETKGHTIGSSTLLINYNNKKFAFVGDAIIVRNNKPTVSKSLAWNFNEALKSYEKIKKLSPVTILPGHGNAITI